MAPPLDYYATLKLNKNATREDVKRAYLKLAKKWHPDKNRDNLKEAEAEFKRVSKAYAVLSDPHKRKVYDCHGEEGVEGFDSDHQDGLAKERKLPVVPPVENVLVCSLEELYNGSKRKIAITRTVLDVLGMPETVEEIIKVYIQPGWKNRTKIVFPNKGDEAPGLPPADLIFYVDEQPHPVFKRDGNDLLVTMKISLLEALTSENVGLTTLDGRYLPLLVKTGHEVLIPNEGMPIAKKPGKRGNLRVKFDIIFPSSLTQEQKSDLKQILRSADYNN